MTNELLKQFSVKRLYSVGQERQWRNEIVGVAIEAPLTIDIEGIGLYTTLCSPGGNRALAVGFMFSEGIIRGMDDIAFLAGCKDNPDVVRVRLNTKVSENGSAPVRDLPVVSSCGLCGSADIQGKLEALPRVGDTLRIDPGIMQRVMNELHDRQTAHKESGGTHAVLIFDAKGNMVSFAEDIGRHNALDKAVGTCLLSGASVRGCGAVLSGRVSFEMAAKCSMAGIEAILAVSAPTSLALTAASQCGITLCAFVRNGGATLYTHPDRINCS